MLPEVYAAFCIASLLLVLLPGPMVTLVVSTSLSHGARAGLLNVAGNEIGLVVVIGVVAAGLSSMVASLGEGFEWVRLAGAAYLVWMGWKLLRSTGELATRGAAPRPRGGFMLQGFLVSISNPKALFFIGAFFPQFVNPAAPPLPQMLLMGVTFMAMAATTDSALALLSGRAGAWLSQRRVRLVNRISGVCLLGGGAWLAFSRSR